ncbi:MAG: sigma 54-interacting transcriptional regulator [Desulfobacterota bacterium]|nr:sigma 54-interacting transcriptional regulator [Thermodesulfobacteriota bacterium]
MDTTCFEWEATFSAFPDPVSIHDDQFRIVKINPALASLLNEKPENILGKKCHQVIHGTDQPVETCPHVQALSKGRSVTERFWDTRLGKSLEVTCSPIIQKEGEITGTIHIIKDLTPCHGRDEALHQARQALEGHVEGRTAEVGTNEQLRLEIALRKQVEETLKERLGFEALLSDLSARFIIVSPEEVNREIEHALKQILEFFQVDRCALVRVLKDKDSWEITHLVQRQEVLPLPVNTAMPASMFPWAYTKILGREVVAFDSLRDLPAEASADKQTYEALGTQANLNIPVVASRSDVYSLVLNSISSERTWPEVYIPRLRVLGEILGNALVRSRSAKELNERLREIEALKQRLETENIYLQEEVKTLAEHSEIVGQSSRIKKVLAQAQQVAQTDSTVLLLGETGTGKELLARVIHNLSRRKDRPLVTVNTASLAPTLIESELFGREKGAYTGALTKQIGRFELADGSSLFLDEIGDLAPELQVKLLRVLQEGRFERLGSPKSIQVNVRIIAATHRDLEEAVQQGKFREDLYYRLAVFPIHIPPLRERPEDIPLMVQFFVNEFAEKMGKRIRNVPRKAIDALQRYSWPGNVRELRNVIERAVIVSPKDTLNVELPQSSRGKSSRMGTLGEAERRHIIEILENTKWRIKGPRGAAELLGLKASTLYSTMSRLGIPTKHKKDDIST